MNAIKSLFVKTKQQRKGIFLLLLLIVVLQCIYTFVEFPSKEITVDTKTLEAFKLQIDSLKNVEIDNKKTKIFPFNPNYISDYKGAVLGMNTAEIDRLLKFRAQNKWVNSAKEFQNVTKVSDSLLVTMSPYFKFPDWVKNPKPRANFSKTNQRTLKDNYEKIDLSTATAIQLQKIYGIGEKLSERIIKYRTKNKGFIALIELQEIYGLSPEVIENIKERCVIKLPKKAVKLNVNTATRDELVTIKYIDYEIAHNIIEERTLREGFKSIDELTKVKDFPIKKIEIIRLYLTIN
ncbi:ComEA family DNA-binding protein [Pontimicrobium sp. MEBiC06410]